MKPRNGTTEKEKNKQKKTKHSARGNEAWNHMIKIYAEYSSTNRSKVDNVNIPSNARLIDGTAK